MEDWSEIFSQIFTSHFLHQILRSSISDVELLQKKILRNEGILRVEPTIQDVREVCLGMQMRCQKTGIKSTGTLSERKMKGISVELAVLKQKRLM